MSSIFRATGFNFQVDDFLKESTFAPDKMWRKGEQKSKTRIHEWSGFTIIVSEAGMDNVLQQIDDAISFLKSNHSELAKLQDFSRAETVYIDFAIEDRDVGLQCDRFPPELLKLAGNLGIGIEIERW